MSPWIGPGPDERDLDDEIVEAARLQARQRVHLRAALHLEDADRVGRAQVVVHRLVGHVERREVDRDAARLPDVQQAVLQQGEHAEAEQVDLHQPHGVEVVLLPLDHRAARHARRLDRARPVRAARPSGRTRPRGWSGAAAAGAARRRSRPARARACRSGRAPRARRRSRRRSRASARGRDCGARCDRRRRTDPPTDCPSLRARAADAGCARGRACPRSARSGSRTARTPRWASAGRPTSSAVAPASPSPSRRATAWSPRCRAPSSLPSALATAPSLAASSAGVARSASAVAFAEKRSLSVRERVGLLDAEAEHARRVAHGARAAVGDLLAHHRRVLAAVALVHVLEHALALAVREVDVDVGRLGALLAQEALEQEVHPDRIDGGDAEAVAHRGVGGRAAPLAEDPLAPREAHDVPDDEEVAREPELARSARARARSAARAPRCAASCRARPSARARPARRAARGTRRGSRRGGSGNAGSVGLELLEPERAPLGDGERGAHAVEVRRASAARSGPGS